MSNDKSLLPLVAVVGPTASGKSALGVWLAERLGGEVVACDSTQLYRGFDIGTAKPSITERRGVPHHLVDVLAAGEEATAGGYRQMAIAVLEMLRQRGRLPILTVGTGLYLRALLEGLADLPQRSAELRARLRASAAKHAPREPLYERIHSRTDAMIAQGWVDEVRALLAAGLAEDAKPFDFIGYREMRAVLRGELKLEEARATIQQATRRYAKRQLTWFRKEAGVQWCEGFGDDPQVQRAALEWLHQQGLPAARSAEATSV
jgi:tRNA dimethylallyltransferase